MKEVTVKLYNNDYVIRNFMLNLDLSNGELLIYALIHHKSNEGKTPVVMSTQYIADLTNMTTRRVISIINSLVDKELVIKKKIKEPITNIIKNEYNIL